jgi:hypothetical protein
MPRYVGGRAVSCWISAAAAALTPTLVPAQTPTQQRATIIVSPAFAQGFADRQTWETWFGGLSAEYKAGAEFWSGQRSLQHPAGCFADGGRDLGAWSKGCIAAQRLLGPADARRESEPDYRLGWNSFSPTQGGSVPSRANQPPPGQLSVPPPPTPAQAAPQPAAAPVALPSITNQPSPPEPPALSPAKSAVAPVAPAKNNQSCEKDWTLCKDNSDLVNNFGAYYLVQDDCKEAANKRAKYGTPIWPGFWSGGAFGRFQRGTDYVTTGTVLAIEKDAQFQNGFGAMVHSTVYCKYDLKTKTVVNVDIIAHE